MTYFKNLVSPCILIIVLIFNVINVFGQGEFKEIVLQNNFTKIDTLFLNYIEKKGLYTFKIVNKTKNTNVSQKWRFSENVKLESCGSYPSHCFLTENSVKFQSDLPKIVISSELKIEKKDTFLIYNSEGSIVYSALLIPSKSLIGKVEINNYILKGDSTSFEISIQNRGNETLNCKINLENNNINFKPKQLSIKPLSTKKAIIELKYKSKFEAKDKIAITSNLYLVNNNNTKDIYKKSIDVIFQKVKEKTKIKPDIPRIWLWPFLAYVLTILLWYFFLGKKTNSKKPSGNIVELHTGFDKINKDFLTSYHKHSYEKRSWPDNDFFYSYAEKCATHAKNVLGYEESVVVMLANTKKSFDDSQNDYDERQYTNLIDRSVQLCLSIKDVQFKEHFTSDTETSKEYIRGIWEKAMILEAIIKENPSFEKINIATQIKERINEIVKLETKLHDANDDIEIKSEEIKSLKIANNQLTNQKNELENLLEEPTEIYIYKHFLVLMDSVLKEIRNLNWNNKKLKKLFLRALNGGDEDKFERYKVRINELNDFPEKMSDQEIDNFIYLFSEIYRMQAFSNFEKFEEIFNDIDFPFEKYRGTLKMLEGFWLNNWDLEIIAPSIYSDIYNQKIHNESNGVSHIISQQMVSVNEYELKMNRGVIRDFKNIGLKSNKLGIIRKAVVYAKK